MEEVGLDVPAHYDEASDRYVIDCPFPQQFDSEGKTWGGTEISWDEVMVRWKGRGPMNETYVAKLQTGYRG
jgi:ring-1,2-phenylacetyl-CoA epoxidase subunit PaaA